MGSNSKERTKRDKAVVETKYSLRSIVGHELGKPGNVAIECAAHEVIVREDECLLLVEANGNDVRSVLSRVPHHVFDRSFLAEQKLLV